MPLNHVTFVYFLVIRVGIPSLQDCGRYVGIAGIDDCLLGICERKVWVVDVVGLACLCVVCREEVAHLIKT